MQYVFSERIAEVANTLNAGGRVLFSGTVYTMRDAAHKRVSELLDAGKMLPFDLREAVVYYAGPTGTPAHLPIGSAGPTTSARMDVYTPRLLDLGLRAMIGKGERSQDVIDSIVRNHSIYFCAIGGAGALAARCVKSCDVIAFPELGCESVKRLVFHEFPLIVAIDANGKNLFS